MLLTFLSFYRKRSKGNHKSDVFKTGESFIKIPSYSVAMHWIRGVDIRVVSVITYRLSSLKGTTMHWQCVLKLITPAFPILGKYFCRWHYSSSCHHTSTFISASVAVIRYVQKSNINCHQHFSWCHQICPFIKYHLSPNMNCYQCSGCSHHLFRY